MDRVIANAIQKATGADVALSNGFRFAPPTAPGVITVADLWTWLPINLELKTGLASGQQLADYWETELENVFSSDTRRLFGGWLPRAAGMEIRFTKKAAAGERLQEALVGGVPLDERKLYTLAAGHRRGAPNNQIHRVSGCQLIRPLPLTVHQVVKRHLAEVSPIRREAPRNIHCSDCPREVRSQLPPAIIR